MREENSTSAQYFIFSHAGEERAEPNRFNLATADSQPAVFTTFRTHLPQAGEPQAFFLLNHHLARLRHDADQHGLRNSIALHQDRDWLRTMLFERVAEFLSSFQEKVEYARVRIALSDEKLELFLDSYTNPWENLNGIKTCTVCCRRQIPELKTNLISESLFARQTAEQSGCQEALLVDSGGILREGAWSNVFWIEADKKIYTTASSVLPGVTRNLLLELFDVELVDLTVEEIIQNAEEIFITQSTTGVTAVVEVDGEKIVDAKPGERTLAIQNAYCNYIENHAEYLEPL